MLKKEKKKKSENKYLIDEKPENILTEKEAVSVEVPMSRQGRSTITDNYKLNRDQNLLVVLVEYKNQKFNSSAYEWGMREESTVEQWQQKIFGVGNENRSLKEYYTEATQDRINIVPAQTSQSSASGVIKVLMEENHPNSDGSQPMPDYKYMQKALQKAEKYIDFSYYDKNRDGELEANELHLMFIVAGFERTNSSATKKAIWAHKKFAEIEPNNNYYFNNGYFAVGEKMMVPYEKNMGGMVLSTSIDVPVSIGPMAHEFGHDLGLPDLYGPSTSDGGAGIGYHSVMSTGMWGENNVQYPKKPTDDSGALPTHFDAYSKTKLGFPVETIENERDILAMDERNDAFKVYKLPIYDEDRKSEKEYYLIENRQIFGFDEGRRAYNGSEGLSIYHINENYSDNLNISKYGDQLVTLKEADESINGYPLLSKGYGDKFSLTSYFKKEINPSFDTKTIPSSLTKKQGHPKFSLAIEDEENKMIKIKFKDTQQIKGIYGTSPWIFDRIKNVLTFGSGVFPDTVNSMTIQKAIESQLEGEKIKKIVIAGDSVKVISGKELFSNLRELESIEGLDKLDTSSVTSMRMMFFDIPLIETLDVSTFDTSKVIDMSLMFYKCSNLTTLDMSSWDTANVTNMQMVFSGLSKIEHLDVSHFKTSKVTNTSDMFSGLTNIVNLDVTNLDTSNVVFMSYMFYGLPNLISLNLTNFNTGKVTHMQQMFYGASKLKSLDLSSFDTRRTQSMQGMFYGCKSLETVNLSNIDTTRLTGAGKDYVFRGCTSLDTLILGENTVFYDRFGAPHLESKSTLPYSGAWIGPDDIRYNSTELFMQGYNGTVPGTYTREKFN